MTDSHLPVQIRVEALEFAIKAESVNGAARTTKNIVDSAKEYEKFLKGE